MKVIKYFTLVLFVGAITFSSCKKEDPITTTPVVTKKNEITTKIDGIDWSGTIYSWASTGGTQQINANATDSTSIQIFMPMDTTGIFEASDNMVTLSYRKNNVTWSDNISGQVIIKTNTNQEIEGSFSLIVGSYFNSDTLSFTEGNFHFKF